MGAIDIATWLLREDRKRVVLAELAFACEVDGVMTERMVYLSSRPYATSYDDTPAHTSYLSVISSVGEFETLIDAMTLSGPSDLNVGTLELSNPDGAVDFIQRLVCDGREVRFYIGDQDWKRRDFLLVGVGVVRRVTGNESRLSIEISDKSLLLDAAVQGTQITSGPAASIGQFRPIVSGAVFNLTPVLLDATALTYAVVDNYGASTLVREVRDAGGSLGDSQAAALFSGDNTALTANAGTDTLTFAGHGLSNNDVVFIQTTGTVFAGLTANVRKWVVGVVGNNFQLSNTRGGAAIDITGTSFSGTMFFTRFRYMDTTAVDGQIQLSAAPTGAVTCDVQTATESAPFDLARRLMLTYGEVTESDIDAAAFSQADTDLVSRLGGKYAIVGFAINQRVNLVDLLNQLLVPLGGWYGQDYDGVIRAGLVDPSNLQAVAHTRTLQRSQLKGDASIENMPISYGGSSINATRNWTTQTDGLLTALTEEQRVLFRNQFRERFNDGNGFLAPSTAYLPFWWASHKTAIPFERDSLLTQILVGAPLPRATTEIATAQVQDAQPWHQLLTVTVGLEAYDWRLGEVVRVTLPRWGFSGGWNFRLVRRRVDPVQETLQLSLITQVTPEYLTTRYN